MPDDVPARADAGRRIALFVPSLAGGGAERVMLTIGRQFARRGFVVDLLVSRSGGALWGSVPQGVRLINLNSWKTPTCLPALFRYIRRDRSVRAAFRLDVRKPDGSGHEDALCPTSASDREPAQHVHGRGSGQRDHVPRFIGRAARGAARPISARRGRYPPWR